MAHDGLMTKTEGTWAFWSPEMCEGGRAFSGYAADLWAAGVCLYIFVTGKLPFYSEAPCDLMEMIKGGNVPYDEKMSDHLVDLLHMALHKDPEKRAGVGDCLQHPFLNTARDRRIRQLSAELARSKATNTVVEESDIRHVSCWWFVLHWKRELGHLITNAAYFHERHRLFVSLLYCQLYCCDQHPSKFKKDTKQRRVGCPLVVWGNQVPSLIVNRREALALIRRHRACDE